MFLYGIAMSILAGLTFVTGHGGGKHYNIDGVVYDGWVQVFFCWFFFPLGIFSGF
jgi:hypothetical protein